MSRDGSGVYHRPVGTDAVTDTTIESTKYNVNVADVEQDLNLPRPIVAGGTGATTSDQALVNLSGEKAAAVVTNYDTQLFQAGSFYSAAGATAAPVAGHSFSGICYVSDPPAYPPTNLNVTLEARDRDDTSQPGAVWVRTKKAGVWSAWANTNPVVQSPPGSPGVPPPNAPDNSFWWDATRGKLFVRYNDGDSTQWVEAVAVPDMDPNAFVNANNPQAFSPAQQLQASTNIGAVNYSVAQALTTSQQAQARTNIGSGPSLMNCGRLTFVSTTALAFLPYNGDVIRINGVIYQIPSGGIAGLGAPTSVFINGVAGQALATNTLYNIFAFNNAGVITADFSLAGRVTSTTPGNIGTEIKGPSDDSRTLIGMVRTGSGTYAADLQTLSWFNRRNKSGSVVTSGGTIQAGQSFMTWGDESVSLSYNGYLSCTAVANNTARHYLDSAGIGLLTQSTTPGANYTTGHSGRYDATLAEGYHTYAVILTFGGTAAAAAFETTVTIRG